MLVLRDGFEPSTSRLSIEGSNLLSYRSIYTLGANPSLVLRPLERPGQPHKFLFKENFVKTFPFIVRVTAGVFRHEVSRIYPAVSEQPLDKNQVCPSFKAQTFLWSKIPDSNRPFLLGRQTCQPLTLILHMKVFLRREGYLQPTDQLHILSSVLPFSTDLKECYKKQRWLRQSLSYLLNSVRRNRASSKVTHM